MELPGDKLPLYSKRGVVLCLLLSLILCWPMWLYGSAFVFADTKSYLSGGQTIWQMLNGMLPDITFGLQTSGETAPASASNQLASGAGGNSTVGRSFTYSALAYAAYATAGYWSIPVLNACTALFMIFALVEEDMLKRPGILITGFGCIAALSTLPWHSVFLMPDIFAGVILLYAGLIAGRYDDLNQYERVLLVALASLMVTFHYGYPPLMAGLAAAVILCRLLMRNLSIGSVASVLIPLCFAPLLNLSASSVVLGEASTTPQRLPILLARSLEDGPAYWYLSEACPEAPHALCELFDGSLPRSVGHFLWREEGISKLSAEEMSRVRDEEFDVIWAAFKAYPFAQLVSLSRNAALQTVMVGTGDLRAASGFGPDHKPVFENANERAVKALAVFDQVTPWATLVLTLPLLVLVFSGALTSAQVSTVFVVFFGVLLNALIFGGLSAPVDRYQSRVVWVLPVLSVLYLASYLSKRR